MNEIVSGIRVVEVRTPTLPPATHTNCYVVGDGELTVFDPASPWEDEQARLWRAIAARLDRGERVSRLVLTHHHHDHVSGALALKDQLARYGQAVPIVAHRRTAELLESVIAVDEMAEEGEVWSCGGVELRLLHTPGHAPGHLVFHDEASGAVVAGDMVAGVGTIVIDPVDGDLGEYLASLERMRGLDATMLLPSHGPPIRHPETMLSFYIAHRHQRTEQIRQALDEGGPSTALGLVPKVYPELAPAVHPLAAVQITSHLLWMETHGLARQGEGSWHVIRG